MQSVSRSIRIRTWTGCILYLNMITAAPSARCLFFFFFSHFRWHYFSNPEPFFTSEVWALKLVWNSVDKCECGRESPPRLYIQVCHGRTWACHKGLTRSKPLKLKIFFGPTEKLASYGLGPITCKAHLKLTVAKQLEERERNEKSGWQKFDRWDRNATVTNPMEPSILWIK